MKAAVTTAVQFFQYCVGMGIISNHMIGYYHGKILSTYAQYCRILLVVFSPAKSYGSHLCSAHPFCQTVRLKMAVRFITRKNCVCIQEVL